MPWKRRIRLLALRVFTIPELVQAKFIVIADRATNSFLALFPPVPFGLASPIDLASFAAIYLVMAHDFPLAYKIQH